MLRGVADISSGESVIRQRKHFCIEKLKRPSVDPQICHTTPAGTTNTELPGSISPGVLSYHREKRHGMVV